MAKLQSSINAEWTEIFSALDLVSQDLLLDEFTALHNTAKEKRRAELRAELGSLTDRPLKAKPVKAVAKYRSLRNPSLTWAGRGGQPAWLKAEMEETLRPLDAFKV
jgi:DNA-binding protein H-NS